MLGGDLAEFFHAFGLARVNAGLQHVLQPVISEKKAQIRIAADEEDSSKKESCLIEGVALKKALVPDLLMPPLLTPLRLGRRHYSLSLPLSRLFCWSKKATQLCWFGVEKLWAYREGYTEAGDRRRVIPIGCKGMGW
ncbi:hypothetical protein B296_00021851 [Ensete ventricosum]|uniref:Uncharacterized protein n=1 Tax=Ensete ventricosum TaxID=4639 RepID=A0A426ZYI5_ENSVE|nr:hypothetical protein B296_00021851 [Ensete ventricosum]